MKVLIIGASGFLGRTVSFKLKKKGVEVLGTYCTNKKDDFINVDVMDVNKLLNICSVFKPNAIIWTIMNHEREEEIAKHVIPKLCEHIGDIRFIFISTSVAYEKDMLEDVKPLIRTAEMYNHHYFNGKIQSEQIIKKVKNYCIVRPGSIYGVNPYGEMDNRSRILKEKIDSCTEYYKAGNIIFSIIEVNELADAIIELIENDYVGIINISEEQPVSHYQFNIALCKKYGWVDKYVIENEAEENIFYLNNDLRKKLLKTTISTINH